MRLLTLVLQWLLLQGLLVLTPLAASAASSSRGPSKETNESVLKLSLALQELVESLSEGETDPTPPSEPDPMVEATERVRNLSLVLEQLVGAVQNNTQALKEAQQQEHGVRCEAPFFRVGQECFYVNQYLRVSWSEARRFCRGLRADLAQPDDVNRLRVMLLHRFPEDRYRFLWLGATETMGKEGNWSWLSKAAVPPREWAEGQPDGGNENCIVLSRDEFPALHDSPCYTHTMFICEAPPAGVL